MSPLFSLTYSGVPHVYMSKMADVLTETGTCLPSRAPGFTHGFKCGPCSLSF